jgi:Tfp pilus assembly protein PilF
METTNTLLLAEYFTSVGYLDRLLFAFTEMERLHYGPRGKNQIQKLLNDCSVFFIKEFSEFELEATPSEWAQFKAQLKTYHSVIESFIKAPYKSTKKDTMVVNYINLLYRNCFEIHNFIMESTNLEIQYPRLGLIQEENIPTITMSEEATRAPLFFLDEKKLQNYGEETSNQKTSLVFLEMKREEKYEFYLHKGHYFIAQKNYEEAKTNFYRARNYKETAEVLTLLAWSHSLLGEKSQAKSYCLKAVQIDSQYGPAYNDFGNYILAEGQVQESLRWFELAKRAHNYQNREYPYINAGRAYVLLKDFDQALTEFSLALTIAPQHYELHDTVAKLKISLEKTQPHYQATTTIERSGPTLLNS